MRIVLIGAVQFSRRVLQRLITLDASVVGVCTLPVSRIAADKSDLSDLCESHDIPWAYTSDINSDTSIEWISALQPDVIFCFGWSRLIGQRLLSVPRLGVVGYHPALLPANRGRHPIIWALALGLPETGSTFFFMDEGADCGDILAQDRIAIEESDTATTLYEKITACALGQLETIVRQLAAGTYSRVAQDGRRANTWRKRGKADGQIDWRMSSRSIHNLVRALTIPYVGAHFVHEGQEFTVWRTQIVTGVPKNVEPGRVWEVSEVGSVIRCGEDAIRLLEVNPRFTITPGEYV